MVCCNLIFMHFESEKRVLPIISDVSGLLSAFVVTRTVWVSLLRPRERAFKVTAKGISTKGVVVLWRLLWRLLWRHAALALLTVAGIVLNVVKYGPGHGTEGYTINLFWSFMNVWILGLTCAVCVEMPKRRCDPRFPADEEGLVRFENSGQFISQLRDISVSACLYRRDGWQNLGESGVLALDRGRIEVPFRIVRRSGERICVSFQLNPFLRRALIGKLFSGVYHQDVGRVSPLEVFGHLARGMST
jgi:cellulose synthase (UDP-forming)